MVGHKRAVSIVIDRDQRIEAVLGNRSGDGPARSVADGLGFDGDEAVESAYLDHRCARGGYWRPEQAALHAYAAARKRGWTKGIDITRAPCGAHRGVDGQVALPLEACSSAKRLDDHGLVLLGDFTVGQIKLKSVLVGGNVAARDNYCHRSCANRGQRGRKLLAETSEIHALSLGCVDRHLCKIGEGRPQPTKNCVPVGRSARKAWT